jgi:cobalt transporter subunit CbtA
MTFRILSAALVAGLWAALAASVLQAAWTTPLILEAESYESQSAETRTSPPGKVDGSALSQNHDEAAQANPSFLTRVERAAFTSLATLVSGVGYALVLLALLLASGATPSRETTLRWALAAFLAVNLAPAIGLPPELPGMGGGDLFARQAWWVFTVCSSGVGLYLLRRVRSAVAVTAAVVALALPHLVGAPHAVGASEVPPALAAQFATRSVAIGLIFWGVLGLALSWAWSRQASTHGVQALG